MPVPHTRRSAAPLNKTGRFLRSTVITASHIWNRAAADLLCGVDLGFVIGGSIVSIATTFKKTWAPMMMPVYAALEGVVLGGISAMAFYQQHPGLVSQVVSAASYAAVYRSRNNCSGLVKSEPKTSSSAFFAATGGIVLLDPARLRARLLRDARPADSSERNVANSVQFVVVVICRAEPRAHFHLHRDGRGKRGAPKDMELARLFGLLVTLVRSDPEKHPRLLAELQSRRNSVSAAFI